MTDPVDPAINADMQTEATNATFTFGSPNENVTYECALDGGLLVPCAGTSKSYTNLQTGSHEFEVQAVDVAGNRDPSAATISWEIGDITPPVVTIDTGPGGTASGGTTNAQIANFTFSVVETGSVVLRCSLDGAEFRVCTSPKEYLAEELAAANNGIIDGLHTFEVEALKHDLLVPADAPAMWEWTIEDIDAPTVTIQGTPPAEIAEGTPFELTLTSNDPTADFECSINGADFAGCASAPPANVASLSLDPGLNTVAVRAVDQAAIPNMSARSRSR